MTVEKCTLHPMPLDMSEAELLVYQCDLLKGEGGAVALFCGGLRLDCWFHSPPGRMEDKKVESSLFRLLQSFSRIIIALDFSVGPVT